MKIIISIIIGISLQLNLFGQDNIVFVWDKDASSISNAKNLLSVHRIIYEFQNKNIKLKYWEENNWKNKSLGIGYRLAKTILIDFQIDHLLHMYQHEVFGHGYRYRAFGYENNSYNINLGMPYGKGGGFAKRGNLKYNRELGAHEGIMIKSAGMESAAILSKNLTQNWLINGKINYRESLLFLSTLHDYSAYIIATKLFNIGGSRNDVNSYLRTVNASYGFSNEGAYRLTLDDILKRTSVNMLNTFQFFAIYTYLKVYLFDGEESFDYPMIKLGSINWLPSIRFGLAPFGSELIIENHIKSEKSIFGVNLRLGDNKLDNFWGGGISFYKNISKNFQLGSYGDFWIQPSMELGGISTFNTNEGFGGRLITELNFHLNSSFPLGFYSQIGYKSTGFIEGESLDKGLIMRIGLSIKSKAPNKEKKGSAP
jgi:hypothetical protein